MFSLLVLAVMEQIVCLNTFNVGAVRMRPVQLRFGLNKEAFAKQRAGWQPDDLFSIPFLIHFYSASTRLLQHGRRERKQEKRTFGFRID